MKYFTNYCLIALLAITTLVGCSRSVKRIDPNTTTDLSGRWNDTDSRLTAQAMIQHMLGTQWAMTFEQRHQKKPVIVVGLVTNKSHEHINTETFIRDLERAIINNGSIRLVEAGERRIELVREREGQQGNASPETTKKWGQELGADFLLQGTISSIIDSYKRNKTVYYQIDLVLSNIETNERVWMEIKEIKKAIRN